MDWLSLLEKVESSRLSESCDEPDGWLKDDELVTSGEREEVVADGESFWLSTVAEAEAKEDEEVNNGPRRPSNKPPSAVALSLEVVAALALDEDVDDGIKRPSSSPPASSSLLLETELAEVLASWSPSSGVEEDDAEGGLLPSVEIDEDWLRDERVADGTMDVADADVDADVDAGA